MCVDGEAGQTIYVKSLLHLNDSAIKITAADSIKSCNETEPQFSSDGKIIAFLSDAKTPDRLQIFIADATTGKLITKQPLTQFNGHVSHLQWPPDGNYVSVLYVEQATRNPNPMSALNRNIGLIDSAVNKNVQRSF
jgi:Tol biopolymer transport system component